jgi:hypothetical protein
VNFIPSDEELPATASAVSVLGTMQALLAGLGKELGDRYDAHMRPKVGADWLRKLGRLRGKRLTLHDPHFVLSEPLYNPQSPTRDILPGGGAFYNLLEDVLDVRNSWDHHMEPPTLERLRVGLKPIHELSSAAGLSLSATCARVKRRIAFLENGGIAEATTAEDESVLALAEELKAARAREKGLHVELAAALDLLEEAGNAASDSTPPSVAALEDDLLIALEERDRLAFIVDGLKVVGEEESTATPVKPGGIWDRPLPTRRATLMTLLNDLMDSETRQSLAAEFGEAAAAQIGIWKKTVPAGSTVYVTPAGQCVLLTAGQPVYLGSLVGDDDDRPEDAVTGFFLPHRYTLKASGHILDLDSSQLLVEVNPEKAALIGQRLLVAGAAGERIRVTTTGLVAAFEDQQWRGLASVNADEWFPGHLAST